MGTILIVILVLLLIGAFRHGRTAGAGDTTPPAVLAWFS
jgi:Protein of unknown function (DUF3309)